MRTIDSKKPIMISGASGYLASWIVFYLLEGGYTVHATVRDKSDVKKVNHLLNIANKSKGKLLLFEADLLKEGSFKAAMEGCELVIHTASPFLRRSRNPQKELITPAYEGTRNILLTVNKVEEVKRVVLTSSVVAIFGDASEIEDTEEEIFTEDHWNLSSYISNQPYRYSKTLAEKEAWRINQEQERWDLVVLNPAFMLGPALSARKDGVSTDFMLDMVNGSNRFGLPNLTTGIVDVRDAAQAHINAGFIPTASGRHILSATTLRLLDMANILRDFFGNKYPIPKRQWRSWILYLFGPMRGFNWKFLLNNLKYYYAFDNTYSMEDLQIQYRPIDETLIDQVKDLEEKGLI